MPLRVVKRKRLSASQRSKNRRAYRKRKSKLRRYARRYRKKSSTKRKLKRVAAFKKRRHLRRGQRLQMAGLERVSNMMESKKQTGIVKWYRHDGTGYIIADDGSGSHYFDHTFFSKMAYKPKKGDKVEFVPKNLMGKRVATAVEKAEASESVNESSGSAYIDDLANTLLADAVAFQLADTESLEEIPEEDREEMRDAVVYPGAEITDSVPDYFKQDDFGYHRYLPTGLIQKMEAAINKSFKGKATLEQLYDDYSEGAHRLIMGMIGHGVSLTDDKEGDEWLAEHGLTREDIPSGYFESPYDEAYSLITDFHKHTHHDDVDEAKGVDEAVDKNYEVWIKTTYPSTTEVDKKFSTMADAEKHMVQLKKSNPDWKIWIDTTSNRRKMSAKFPEAGETDDTGQTESVEKATTLHSTLQSNIYYTNFANLPKAAQKKLEDAKLEIENSKYTIYEDSAFIRAEVEVNGALWDAEISLGSVDIRHSDYKYDEEKKSYVDDQGREIDSDQYAENIAEELLAVTDLENCDVHLTHIEDIEESMLKESSGKKVVDYDVIDHGIEHEQYFQGHGTAFTKWDDAVTGIGQNAHEAFEDALEMLAQSGWDVSEIDEPSDLGKEEVEHDDMWYHVSIDVKGDHKDAFVKEGKKNSQEESKMDLEIKKLQESIGEFSTALSKKVDNHYAEAFKASARTAKKLQECYSKLEKDTPVVVEFNEWDLSHLPDIGFDPKKDYELHESLDEVLGVKKPLTESVKPKTQDEEALKICADLKQVEEESIKLADLALKGLLDENEAKDFLTKAHKYLSNAIDIIAEDEEPMLREKPVADGPAMPPIKEEEPLEETGEADQDYDHEVYEAIVKELEKSGYEASHKEFDKHQGVHLKVKKGGHLIDTLSTIDMFVRGKTKKGGPKHMSAHLLTPEGEKVSASRGDYFMKKDSHVLNGHTLVTVDQGGKQKELKNPKISDLPDIGDVGHPGFDGKPDDVLVLQSHKTGAEMEVEIKKGKADIHELVAHLDSLKDPEDDGGKKKKIKSESLEEKHIGFKELEKEIKQKSHGKYNAAAVAAKIGREKLGQKEMTRRSVAARKRHEDNITGVNHPMEVKEDDQSGVVITKDNKFLVKDMKTKGSYELKDQSKAKALLGAQVNYKLDGEHMADVTEETKHKAEWGFDLTGFNSPDDFKEILEIIGAKEKPSRGRIGQFIWKGKHATVVTGNNPITGEYSGGGRQREPEFGYASYIGIYGDDEGKVKQVADKIKELTSDIKDESPGESIFIGESHIKESMMVDEAKLHADAIKKAVDKIGKIVAGDKDLRPEQKEMMDDQLTIILKMVEDHEVRDKKDEHSYLNAGVIEICIKQLLEMSKDSKEMVDIEDLCKEIKGSVKEHEKAMKKMSGAEVGPEEPVDEEGTEGAVIESKLNERHEKDLDEDYPELDKLVKEAVEEAFGEVESQYELFSKHGVEQIEHKSRDGFISSNDGGYQAIGFTDISMLMGSGSIVNLPKKAQEAIEKLHEQNMQYALDAFKEQNKEQIKDIPEDKLNYHDLYDMGKGELAEKLSELENEQDSDEQSTVMFQVRAMFENGGPEDLSFTIQGVVNWEAPYHRPKGQFEDYYQSEVDFTQSEIPEIIEKVKAELKKAIAHMGV